MNPLEVIVQKQKANTPIGVYSVCSSNWHVLKAAIANASEEESYLLIEPTANQVNQFGGYTGMTPEQFVEKISHTAKEMNFPFDRLILGGDHLGPNPWQTDKAQTAMEKSITLVRDYVASGFRKIHLDTSIRCKDDPGSSHEPMDDRIVAERTAQLCRVAEKTYKESVSDDTPPVYVIGTEVPIPGGAEGGLESMNVTTIESANRTIEVTKSTFLEYGLEDVWPRVIATVVQPGVEFGDSEIYDYKREDAKQLSDFIKQESGIVFEAHSTDYQLEKNLKALVEDQFAILKVGPWLTYAFREAVFALSFIENELLGTRKPEKLSDIQKTLDTVMRNDSRYWDGYYKGDDSEKRFARRFSYSDRSRYYWQNDDVQKSLNLLFKNLEHHLIPETLLSQYLPGQYTALRNAEIANQPSELIKHKISEVLKIYSRATKFYSVRLQENPG